MITIASRVTISRPLPERAEAKLLQPPTMADGYYETQDGLSWGVNPTYSHDWNQGGSEIKLQISRRETPTLPTERCAQIEQSYFQFLPFAPVELTCLALAEILAEKIRACYQRNKARDIYNLGMFANRPLDHALIRRLVVLKLWQARDTFDPARLMQKFQDGRDFDWDDLRDLLRRTIAIDREFNEEASIWTFLQVVRMFGSSDGA